MDITEFRTQYPQYDDMSDIDLGNSLYTKHYSDMPREEFDAQFIAPILPEPGVDVYGGVDPQGVMAGKAEEQKALDFIGGLSEAQMTGPTEGKVGFQEGGTSFATPISVFGETAVQTAKDVGGVVAKAGAGLIKGATLGAVDPEAGTVGIPFTDIKKKVAQKLSVSLQEVLGTSPEIAENPYIQVAPEMVGTILPWQKAQKLVSAVGKAKTAVGRVAETAATGALIGAATVRDKDNKDYSSETKKQIKVLSEGLDSKKKHLESLDDFSPFKPTALKDYNEQVKRLNTLIKEGKDVPQETLLSNALTYAATGAGLHLAGEAIIPLVNYIKSAVRYKTVTKNISSDDLYNAFKGADDKATPEAIRFVRGLTKGEHNNIARNMFKKGEGVQVVEKIPRFQKKPKVSAEPTKPTQPVKAKVPAVKVAEKPVIKPEATKKVKPKQVVKPEKKVAEIKEIPSDKKVSKGIPSKVKEGEKLVKAEPVKSGGKEKVETGGILRKEKGIKPYSVGSSVKLGKSPQVNTIVEELPSTPQEKELGERFFKIKNEKTGEVQEVTYEDITPIKLKPVTPEPAVPLKEKVAKKLAEEKGEVTVKEAEAFAGKKAPVWESMKKMRQESKQARKVTKGKIFKELNKAIVDTSGNFKREAAKYGEEGYRLNVRKTLFAGAHGSAIEDLNNATKSIYGGISEKNHDYLDTYLYAKRSLEILKTRPDFKFHDNIKKEQFEAIIDEIPKDQIAKIEKRAKKNWDVYGNLLKELHNEGIITKGELKELAARGQNYSPREILEYLDPGSSGGGGKLSVTDSGLKTLSEEGSLKAVETDSALLLSQAITRTKTRIFKNRAAKALYDLAKAHPDNGLAKLAKVIRTTKDGKAVYQPAPNGYEKVSAMVNGVKKEMIMPSDMAKEWVKSDPLANSLFMDTISTLTGTKLLKAMATGLNPEFALTNLPRDLAFVWVNTQEYSDFMPKAALQIANDVLSSLGTASGFRPVKGAKSLISGKDLETVIKDTFNRKGWAKEYIKRGGSMEFLTQQGRFAPKMKGHVGKLQDVMGYAGGTSELVVRIATMKRAYENMKAAGRTDHEQMMDEAVFIARNYLDFSQGGYATKLADPISPYLNAAIQGTRGALRAAESHPKKTALKLGQIALAATGLFYSNYYLNKECWDSIPHRDKVNNWIFTSPFWYHDADGNKKWFYIRIPKDQTQRLVASVSEQVAAKAIGEDVDMDQVTMAATDLVPASLPPVVKAWMGYQLNKDFYRGEDIWRGSREDIKAEEEYYKNYTHDFFVQAGKKTGMSPERTKYALSQVFTTGNVWTSGVALGWNKMFDKMSEDQQEKVTEELILKKPFIRKLFRHTDPYHKYSKEIKDVTIEERTKKFVMMRDFNDIVQKKLDDKATNKDIVSFIQKNPKDASVLKDHYKRAILLKDMPEKRYWKELAKTPAPARARLFWARWAGESPEERIKSLKTAKKIPGFYSDAFNRKFGELRSQTKKEEANKGRK